MSDQRTTVSESMVVAKLKRPLNRRIGSRYAFCLLLIIACSHFSAAEEIVPPTLNPELAIHQYARRSWWVEDGLPSNRVH